MVRLTILPHYPAHAGSRLLPAAREIGCLHAVIVCCPNVQAGDFVSVAGDQPPERRNTGLDGKLRSSGHRIPRGADQRPSLFCAWHMVTYVLPCAMIAIREYLDPQGCSPFADWFESLNAAAAAKVTTTLARIEQGKFLQRQRSRRRLS